MGRGALGTGRARLGWRAAAPALLLLAAATASPDPQAQQAQQAATADLAARAAAQQQADLAARQAQDLATQRVAAAARLLATEGTLAAAEQRVDELARRREHAEALLGADSRALAPLLPLIERLSLFPTETLLAVPGSPEDAVRGVLVLGGLARQLRARAAQVAEERAQVRGLQAQLDAALPDLRRDEQAQLGQSAALDAALAQARQQDTAAQMQAELATRRAQTDAARADTLRHAIAVLDAARAAAARRAARAARLAQLAQDRAAAAAADMAPPAASPPAAAIPAAIVQPQVAPLPVPAAGSGGWSMPAAGRVVHGFGASGDEGPASGITLQTPPGARVVAPCGGHVEFAAPFRSYGLLVIIACGGDTHVVLSGLQRLDATSGQAVAAGEPVGIMAPQGGGALYLELRRAGTAVDPVPYLRRGS